MAETGGRGNRTLHIGAGALDRGFDRLALREPGSDCRGERTAGTVRMAAVDARTVPDALTIGGREHVVDRVAREMPGLEQDGAADESQHIGCSLFQWSESGDGMEREDIGVVEVR